MKFDAKRGLDYKNRRHLKAQLRACAVTEADDLTPFHSPQSLYHYDRHNQRRTRRLRIHRLLLALELFEPRYIS